MFFFLFAFQNVGQNILYHIDSFYKLNGKEDKGRRSEEAQNKKKKKLRETVK